MANFNPNAPGTAQLVTNRYDFQAHVNGTNFRHNATEIDMSPAIVGGATTVQSTLSSFNTIVELLQSGGQGFITVGDGYNTWDGYNSTIANPFDSTVPSLDTLLNPIFQLIYTGGTVPADYARIQNGGIVVIKAGTYLVKKTIYVPPGIVLVGEGYGTKIINATNLNTSSSPPSQQSAYAISSVITNGISGPMTVQTTTAIPNLASGDIINISGVTGITSSTGAPYYNPNDGANSTVYPWVVQLDTSDHTGKTFYLYYGFSSYGNPGSYPAYGTGSYSSGSAMAIPMKPLFQTLTPQTTVTRSSDDGAITGNTTNYFAFERETKIMNMVIADNFVLPPTESDISAKNYWAAQNYTSTSVVNPPGLIQQEAGTSLVLQNVMLIGRASSDVTGSAIFLDTSNFATGGSTLSVTNCTIDGFSIPIIWQGNAGGSDYMEVSNSKIRGFGSYGSGTGAANNCIFSVNDSTTKISNNTIFGNSSNVVGTVYVNGTVSSAPALQARGKLIVTGNDVIIGKTSNTTNSSYSTIQTSIASLSTYLSYMSYGNNFQDRFDVTVDGNMVLSGTSTTLNVNNFTSPTDGYAYFDGYTQFNGAMYRSFNQLGASGFYTVDSGSFKDYVIVAPTNLGPVTVVLPRAAQNIGRVIVIKDIGSASLTSLMSIFTLSGDQFESPLTRTSQNVFGADVIEIATPFTSITLVAGNGSWYII